ncbi:sodium/potassium-transporting ATPase subunit beta-1-like isoform X2 [Uranotaenia lowii]|nr:sodium/potassium-transporting ATPase subunit beta-1-like isoform X2 [Uranotaenia lowii]
MLEKVATKEGFQFPVKPPDRTFWQYLYDKRTHTVMDRTKGSWARLALFYAVYFIVLGALTWACFQGLFATLSDQYPKYQLADSLIGTNPGMGYRPIPEDPEDAGFIKYRARNKTETKYWVGRINSYLEPYKNLSLLPMGGQNHVNCDFDKPPASGEVCKVDITAMSPCTSENGFGYNQSSPCVIIKLNRIYGWVPEPFDDVEDLPDEMPHDLVEHIKSLPEKKRNKIWVSCNGIYSWDNEAMGPVSYHPEPGIPGYYYPYLNQPGYLSPIIAVQFERPKLKQAINIECRAWAKNMFYRGGSAHRQGSFAFALLVE